MHSRHVSNGGSWFSQHGEKLKQVTKEYGQVAVVFHSTVFLATLGSAYASIRMGVDIRHVKVPFINLEDINPDAGSFLLAYLATLATGPLRGGITIVSTPWIARMLRKHW
ncbi:hypothetical protein H310_11084 [Aphanomyces invadans]|uniref:DUF1279 domain-containing protein n=1 Tax=Aphanomyces invadans TaxID=157072 RepID=A0A024TND5_9STRA|nr:hypothetical protein H310_11084 [Aphanomyces invadans]ETV95665.1 hypothetical protein H310_11084 [Aphanomyces invadans]|eukprot:XP_008875858.1 hypothetical protein H310_11084 [Aphanomyces invadans]